MCVLFLLRHYACMTCFSGKKVLREFTSFGLNSCFLDFEIVIITFFIVYYVLYTVFCLCRHDGLNEGPTYPMASFHDQRECRHCRIAVFTGVVKGVSKVTTGFLKMKNFPHRVRGKPLPHPPQLGRSAPSYVCPPPPHF